MKIIVCLVTALLCLYGSSFGQTDSTINQAIQLPNRIFEKITKKVSKLNNVLAKQTEKYLQRLEKQEEKLQRQLYRVDSASAKNLFSGDPQGHYKSFIRELKTDSGKSASYSGDYLPYSDSVKVVMEFIEKNPAYSPGVNMAGLEKSIGKYSNLQGNLAEADRIKQYISERKEKIKEYLLQEAHLPSSISSIYKQYSEGLYYYTSQIQSYKETLDDPDKLFKTALANLNKLPVFQSFMQKNSYLASLLPMQDAVSSQNYLNGLQTRDQLQQLIHIAIPSVENASNALNGNIDNAKSELDQLQDKYLKYGQTGQSIDDPQFKPNLERNKSFLKRLEYGTTFQTQGSTYGVPATCNIGLTVGYKLKGSNDLGVGISYLVGLGKPIMHMQVSSQGIGFRSFFDFKLKASFYFSGGFEYNQVPLSTINQVIITKQWQTSGLVGLSKIIDIKSKILKKTKVQLLWNFLSYYQTGPVQPIVFRVGYGL